MFKLFRVLLEKCGLLLVVFFITSALIVCFMAQCVAQEFRAEWDLFHPREYQGRVWIQVKPQIANINVVHTCTVRWGPWEYQKSLSFFDEGVRLRSISLVHTKDAQAHSVPLRVTISPPANVTIGQGNPPNPDPIDISYGWRLVE